MFRNADGLVERMYGGFVSVNLDPRLPQRKLYQNLRGLGIVNVNERLQVATDVEFSDYRPIRGVDGSANEETYL
jgi:hypothetical protein